MFVYSEVRNALLNALGSIDHNIIAFVDGLSEYAGETVPLLTFVREMAATDTEVWWPADLCRLMWTPSLNIFHSKCTREMGLASLLS
jgi:hypothetical protein